MPLPPLWGGGGGRPPLGLPLPSLPPLPFPGLPFQPLPFHEEGEGSEGPIRRILLNISQIHIVLILLRGTWKMRGPVGGFRVFHLRLCPGKFLVVAF